MGDNLKESTVQQPTVQQSEKEKKEWLETFEKLNEMRSSQDQGLRSKMTAKIKQNPFVPIGMVATTIALSAGLMAMRKGDKKKSQLMMRARIGAQGFTVVAILLGIIVAAKTKPA